MYPDKKVVSTERETSQYETRFQLFICCLHLYFLLRPKTLLCSEVRDLLLDFCNVVQILFLHDSRLVFMILQLLLQPMYLSLELSHLIMLSDR